jgi:hypothetical protein
LDRPTHGRSGTSVICVIATLIVCAQLHCAPNASGSVDCYDAQKGGAPTQKIERNLFGGFDLRHEDGKIERCEKTASGETACRVVQEGRVK